MSSLGQIPISFRLIVVAFLALSSPALAQTVNIRSIGKNTGNLHASGLASVPIGSPIVTFTAALPAPNTVGAVGPGDELVIGGETRYIKSYDSPTQVTLQSNATADHSTPPRRASPSNAPTTPSPPGRTTGTETSRGETKLRSERPTRTALLPRSSPSTAERPMRPISSS